MDLEVQEKYDNEKNKEQNFCKFGILEPSNSYENYNFKILKQSDLYEILPFKKTKVQALIKSGELPLVKIGKDYITTFKILEESIWR